MTDNDFSRLILKLLLLVSGLSLAAALFGQFGMGLQPCVLCIYQRIPYMLVILIATIGLMPQVPLKNRRILIMACGLVFLIGAGIAIYHVGVEKHWWEGTKGCGGGAAIDDIEALKAQIMNAPIVRCDQVAWEFLGLSIPAYNFIWQILLLGITYRAAQKIK